MALSAPFTTLLSALRNLVLPPPPPRPGPTLHDVYAARALLTLLGLPSELADLILDHAEYWAVQRFRTQYNGVAGKRLDLFSTDLPPAREISALFLETDELGTSGPLALGSGKTQHRTPVCRKVVFRIRSCDQGWVTGRPETDNDYLGSFSWFDATIFRPMEGEPPEEGVEYGPWETLCRNPEFESSTEYWSQTHELRYGHELYVAETPESAGQNLLGGKWRYVTGGDGNGVTWLVQRNKVAWERITDHEIVWTTESTEEPTADEMSGLSEEEQKERRDWPANGAGRGAGFVNSIQAGDRIGIWPRAKYPGWSNHIESVQVDVYFAV